MTRGGIDVDRPGLYRNVFYTPAEVALILGVSVRTVHRLLKGRDTPLKRRVVSRRNLRVYGADLAEYLGISLEETPVKEDSR